MFILKKKKLNFKSFNRFFITSLKNEKSYMKNIILLKKYITEIQIKDKILKFSCLIYIYCLFLWYQFDYSQLGFQSFTKLNWFSFFLNQFNLGFDSTSLFLVLLTSFLTPLCLLFSWDSIKEKSNFFFLLFFLIEIFILIVFSTLDLIIFYIFFESVLLPMFIIIGFWGSRDRKLRASMLFFMYTLIGSLLMLIGVLMLYLITGTSNYLILSEYTYSFELQKILWILFFASFAAKIPIIPFHIWLPEAHVEAPTPGSVILAGLLLKLGTYGFLRYSVSLFSEANIYFSSLVYVIGCVSVLYASLIAIRQTDIKRIIAYSSIAHMNLVLMGLVTNTLEGYVGSIFQMISHGFISSALFLCIGVLYNRTHSRLILHYGGCVQTMPLFSFFFLSFILANIAFPSTCNFIGEILLFMGLTSKNIIICLISTSGMVLAAIYSLWLANRILFTNIKLIYLKKPLLDVNLNEAFILFLFFIANFIFGLFPNLILYFIYSGSLLLIN